VSAPSVVRVAMVGDRRAVRRAVLRLEAHHEHRQARRARRSATRGAGVADAGDGARGTGGRGKGERGTGERADGDRGSAEPDAGDPGHRAPTGRARSTRAARSVGATALLVAALLVAVAASLAVGARSVPLGHVLGALLDPAGVPTADAVVVRDLRVPRTVIGLLAGVLVRGVTRNPVADPGLLGVNAGAALGVVSVLALGLRGGPATVAAAMAGALGAAAVVAVVAARARRDAPALLVVAGAAVTAGLTSLTSLVLLADPGAAELFRFWTVGALTGRGLATAGAIAPLVLVGAVVAVALARPLDALALGDDIARGLGFRVAPVRAVAVLAVVLLCGSATALAGPLVFVGLVAAQAARATVGTRHAHALPVAALAGAALLLAADTLGRVVAPPGELEAGVVVALAGAPMLVHLVRRGGLT